MNETPNIYVIEYYAQDKRFHWTNTCHDRILASSEEEAKRKFQQHHPEQKTFFVSNIYFSDY